ncbi:helix-turn-helix transcriptional regulator [Silvimonas amylolytica]|uniref:HTH luxR-type domain-containing protein n=1 Tax=Silvimonas amylolytica TaxID=449663 RepID=A0ABQ2PGU9_9NEIS|nr:helix-turn-helix transcriptional regulator [Silvimonas amylolytica]GGP24837.1 hypothetical protein GCM10010971_06560 [Silvimonas amylolytica]
MTQGVSEVIDSIYASVEDPSRIPDSVGKIALLGGGYVGQYIKMDVPSRQVISSSVSDSSFIESQWAYSNYFAAIDPRIAWFVSGQIGDWRPDQFQFDEQFVKRSELYNEFLKPYGAKRVAVNCIRRSGNIYEAITIARLHDAGDYEESNLQVLASLSNHLVRAATLRARLAELEEQHQAAEETLKCLPYGAVWLDARQRIVWMSPPVATYLALSDGIKVAGQRLLGTDAKSSGRLDIALKRATNPYGREGSWFTISRSKQNTPWLVSVIPSTEPPECCHGHRGPYALVILQDGAGPDLPHARQLQLMYGLTAAESRLALGLLQNATVESYAEQHQISSSTVRTHLRQLFAKTWTHRQAELLRVLGLPLAMRAPESTPRH